MISRIQGLLFVTVFALFCGPPAGASVELHAHLFMDHAMTYAFRGSFHGPLKATDWRARMSSQIDVDAVNHSGIRILVASLYAHPLFRFDLRQAVRDQVQDAEHFVAENPNWMIARSPVEARAALNNGKRVMILSLEGALGVLETPADIREFIDEKGIRIVTPIHLTDDRYGGAAFMRGILVSFNPLALIRSFFHTLRDEQGVRVNDRGLTLAGTELVRDLLAHRVWIDLSHTSDHSLNDLSALLQAQNQPLLYTHTVLRRYHGAERGLSDQQLAAVAASRGIVGLMPSQDYLQGTPPELESGCPQGMGIFARQFRELSKKLSPTHVMSGSDFNGGIYHLPPGCAEGTDIEKSGFWNLGQTAELYRSLVIRGAAPSDIEATSETAFLDAWDRAVKR